MRQRKKFIVATLILVAAYASMCFWPHSNPQAVRALETMRGMVEVDEGKETPQAAEAKSVGDVQIECRVVIATINLTDATAGLFAEPGQTNDKAVVGRLTSPQQFLEIGRSAKSVQIESEPIVAVLSGQTAGVWTGGEVEVSPLGGGGAPAAISYSNIGTNVNLLAQMTAGGAIVIDVDCKLTYSGRTKTVTTPQGTAAVPDIHTISAKARSELKIGETLVIGGMSQKRPGRTMFGLPGLRDLPVIGSWFCFSREREFEEELVVLVTPTVVSPVAAK